MWDTCATRSTGRSGGRPCRPCGVAGTGCAMSRQRRPARRRLPVRWRLTLVFGAAMAVLLAGIGAGLYAAVAGSLLDEVDTGLRSRAATLRADVAIVPTPAALPDLGGSASG